VTQKLLDTGRALGAESVADRGFGVQATAADQKVPGDRADRESPGHAVEDGFVRFLSVSAIQKFDPSEPAGCNRAWWFRYREGIKEPETEPLRFGKALAKELEHYLKTGVDVLGPVARAGKHLLPAPGPDLEVEEELGDIRAAVAVREAARAAGRLSDPLVAEEIRRLAGLTAAGIPLMGAADLRHARGEYVGPDGILRREELPDVTEIVDHKSSSRINTSVSASGRVYEGYGKTLDQIHQSVQMVGYGVHAAYRRPRTQYLREGFIYYQTKAGRAAEKRTGIIPVETVLRRWERVESVARVIEHVAREPDVSKVEPNLAACNAYHRPCHYTERCPRSVEQIFASMFAKVKTEARELRPKNTEESETMSILAKLKPDTASRSSSATASAASQSTVSPSPIKSTNGAAASVAVSTESAAQRQAAIEAEKARLRAEEAPVPSTTTTIAVATPTPQASAQGEAIALADCDMDESYFVGNRVMTFAGSSKGIYFFTDEASGERLRVSSAEMPALAVRKLVAPQTPQHQRPAISQVALPAWSIGVINPPDGPPPGKNAADPLPAQVLADPTLDPEIRARAEALAAASKADEDDEPEAAGGGGRCVYGKQRVVLTMDQVADRKMTCPECRKELKLKPARVSADKYEATVPGHNRPRGDFVSPPLNASSSSAPGTTSTNGAPSTTTVVQFPAGKTTSTVEPAPTPPVHVDVTPAENFRAERLVVAETPAAGEPVQVIAPVATVYLDCAVIGAPQPRPLAEYYDPILKTMLDESAKANFPALDVRCAPEGSPLAYKKWAGILSALVRARPIAPGDYVASSSNDIEQVVVQALRCRTVVGVR